MDATRFEYDEAVFDALAPDERRQAIGLLAELVGGRQRNPLWGFDPLDPNGSGAPHLPQHRFLQAWKTPAGDLTKFRMLPGGNRGGKTTTGDLSVMIDCADREAVPPHLRRYKRWEPPVDFFIVAVSGRLVEKIHLPIFRKWCPKDQLVGNSVARAFNKEYQTLHFKNGSTISFMTQGMEVDVFQGVPLHGVLFDEEPLWDHGLEIFTECMQRLVDFNGDCRFTFTPLNGMTWLYDSLYLPWASQQPEREAAVEGFATIQFGGFDFPLYCHVVDQDDNPVIDPEGKAAALAMARNDEERKSRKSGRFVSFAGKIYDDFSTGRIVVPDEEVLERMNAQTVQAFVGGLDPGFRHQAGVCWVTLDQDGVWVFPELALEKTLIENVAAEIQRTAAAFNLRPAIFMADPAIRRTDHQTGLTDQDAYLKAGVLTRLANNDVRAGINTLRSLIAGDRLHIAASCEVLLDQFGRARWKKQGRSEDAAPERPVKRDDHVLDALRYAVMSLPIPEVAGTPDTRTDLQKLMDADVRRAIENAQEPQGAMTIGVGQFD